jgi:hypothetical protein
MSKPGESGESENKGTEKMDMFKQFKNFMPKDSDISSYLYITIGIVTVLFLILFGWIYDRLDLRQRTCTKLEKYYSSTIGKSYFTSVNTVTIGKTTSGNEFDVSNCILRNYYVKSAYNCCCGDGYKNNFVNLCALEKCILNGCRFLDFEIYSYNNKPIVASSTANNNFIKETYNSLDLEEVFTTITSKAFNAVDTNCHRDPLILNFRIMSTNISTLEKIGSLIETHFDIASSGGDNFRLMKQHTYINGTILDVKMKDLYKTIIIICDFYPSNNILETNSALDKLKSYISLKGKSEFCKTYRYNQILGRTTQFIDETKRNYVIVLPNLTNSIINNEFATSYGYGCQAICMKYQNYDENLQAYNRTFLDSGNYSWKLKPLHLITNVLAGFVVVPFTTHRPLANVRAEIQSLLSRPG